MARRPKTVKPWSEQLREKNAEAYQGEKKIKAMEQQLEKARQHQKTIYADIYDIKVEMFREKTGFDRLSDDDFLELLEKLNDFNKSTESSHDESVFSPPETVNNSAPLYVSTEQRKDELFGGDENAVNRS